MDFSKMLEISSALSDELRIKVLYILASEKPMRYSEIMKSLGLDVTGDSSKFAYHVGVLCDAGLMEKVDDSYRITQGGKEVFSSIRRVAEGWAEYRYRDSIKRMTGRDLNKKIWSNTLLWSGINWILTSALELKTNPNVIYPYMMASGLAFLALSGYWMYELRDDFSDVKLERFLAAAINMLGENGLIMGLIQALSSLGLITLAIVGHFLGRGMMSLDLLTMLIVSAAIGALFLGLYLSSRLTRWWDVYLSGGTVRDHSRDIDVIYHLLLGILVMSGVIMMLYGSVGGGIGVLGAAFGIWNGFNKYRKLL